MLQEKQETEPIRSRINMPGSRVRPENVTKSSLPQSEHQQVKIFPYVRSFEYTLWFWPWKTIQDRNAANYLVYLKINQNTV